MPFMSPTSAENIHSFNSQQTPTGSDVTSKLLQLEAYNIDFVIATLLYRWNRLPASVQATTSLSTFRRELKTFLFRSSYYGHHH